MMINRNQVLAIINQHPFSPILTRLFHSFLTHLQTKVALGTNVLKQLLSHSKHKKYLSASLLAP